MQLPVNRVSHNGHRIDESPMRLSWRAVALLFAVGAAGGLIGDAGHVQSGTTTYLMTGVPFIWESAIWFVFGVGLGTVALAEIRLRIAPARTDGDISDGVGAIAVVIGIYALTSLTKGEPLLASTVVIWVLAAIAWHVSGDGKVAAICGALAALVGTTVEIIITQAEVSEYFDALNGFFGVPPWLPALYFAFGVAVSRLAELCVKYGWATDGREPLPGDVG